MSQYSSVIIFACPLEDDLARRQEIELFKNASGQNIHIRDLSDNSLPDIFPRSTFAGTYNYLDLKKFLNHLKEEVHWKYPEYVQIFVSEEGHYTGSFYTDCGNKLLSPSIPI